MKKVLKGLSLLCGLGLTLGVVNASATSVGLELALLVDISGSISGAEYNLQKDGYVAAFRSAAIQQAIVNYGGIAVTYVEWSGSAQQYQRIGWTQIADAAGAETFAGALEAITRSSPYNLTAPGSAIDSIDDTFFSNSFDSTRQVIDVSGDGIENDGIVTSTARNNALALGIDAINGLAIGDLLLEQWYQKNIMGGTNAFTLRVDGFNDFGDAIQQKLYREISGVPEPTTMLLFGTGLAGLAAIGRRRKEN